MLNVDSNGHQKKQKKQKKRKKDVLKLQKNSAKNVFFTSLVDAV